MEVKKDKNFVFPFEKLDVWNIAVDFAIEVLDILETLPPNRHLRLISQLEAASSSISQNIAEGKGRQYKKEFIQFLYIAEGSLYEAITLLEIFRKKGLFSEKDCENLRSQCEIIDRKLNGLKNFLLKGKQNEK